jgi:copper resistance protein D
VDDLIIASRFVHFVAVSVLFGGSLFRLCIQPHGLGIDRPLPRMIDLLAVVAALLSALAWFVGVSASMAGSPSEMVNPEIMAALLFETQFGRLWIARLILIAALVALIFAWRGRTQRREIALLVLSGTLTASLAGVGHGSSGAGWLGPAHLVADMIHLLCAATWLGGLVCLVIILHRAVLGRDIASIGAMQTLLPRFSRVGYVAVAILLMTGCFNAIILLERLDDLIATDYGRVLFLKIGLVAAMVAIAVGNRLMLSPRILVASTPDRRSESVSALYRSVTLELGVGFIVLASTAILGTIQHH